MLGIQSEISNQKQVSQLSISSNASKMHKDKNHSTSNPSTLNSEGLAQAVNSTKNQKIRQLRIRMEQIAKNQQFVNSRMKAYVDVIQKQLKKKEERNAQLENMIADLKDQLNEGKGDLQVLSNYLTKRQCNQIKSPTNIFGAINSNKNHMENKVEQKKIMQIKIQKPTKSISPLSKNLLLSKRNNLSPRAREQKKPSQLLASPLIQSKKVRSPKK